MISPRMRCSVEVLAPTMIGDVLGFEQACVEISAPKQHAANTLVLKARILLYGLLLAISVSRAVGRANKNPPAISGRVLVTPGKRSEVETKRELQLAVVSVFACDLAKLRAGRVEIHAIPVRMVERIIGLRPELESGPFVDGEPFEEAQVPVIEPGVVDGVTDPFLMIEGAFRRLRVQRRTIGKRGLEPVERIVLSTSVVGHLIEVSDWSVFNPVLPDAAHTAVQTDADEVVAGSDAAWRAGLRLEDAADLPPAGDLSVPVLLRAQERQFVEEVGDEVVSRTKFRRSLQVMLIVCVWNDIALIRSVVHALGERICDAEQQPLGEAPVPGDLQGVVSRAGDVVCLADRVVAEIGAQRV